jgi:hypothetical protein
MIPPNAYLNRRTQEMTNYLTSGTNTKRVEVGYRSDRFKSLNIDADSIKELTEECGNGNGDAKASLQNNRGETKETSTRGSNVIRRIQYSRVLSNGVQYLRDLFGLNGAAL